ncbi:hypothetical protein [Dactylosporangium sp. NPDC051541]|uniref:hypothetical protein n=1 Tax=Dactylosporangium sp. NPDC051541 TaxID=3363977 RepID=UPI00379C6522
MPRAAVVKLVVSCLLLTACGDTGARADAAATTAQHLLSAVRDGDGAAACAMLAPDTVDEVARSAGQPCPDAITGEDLPGPGSVDHVRVDGQWAQVTLSDDTVFLARFPGGWRVVAAGCRAHGERPYQCSVKGG